MKNMEVLHTLRLYDSDFVTKLAALMEREQENYRNKNEFLTAILRNGYEAYTSPVKKANGPAPNADKESLTAPNMSAAAAKANDSDRELYALISEMNQCMTMQLKVISLYQEIHQKLLSSIYRTMLSLAGGEKVIQSNVDAGFFDDLPARFERILLNLKERYGV